MTTHDWMTIASLLRYAVIAAAVIYVATAITKGMRDIAKARAEAGRAVAEAHDRAAEATRQVSPKLAAMVKPGDTLVLGFDRTISHEQFETIADKIREALPAEVRFVVVSGVTSMAVQRPEEK